MRLAIAVCLVLMVGACGGVRLAPKGLPLTADEERAFDNGVDFVATLEGIEGRWREDWERDISVRVSSADLIALVTVHTLRTDTDPQQRVTYRLLAHADRTLIGAADRELELTVAADEPGFRSVNDGPTRVADKQFVVYIRVGPDGPRWHLSHASEPMLLETERKITALKRAPKPNGGERVIVHTN